jgi:hypothetical protein
MHLINMTTTIVPCSTNTTTFIKPMNEEEEEALLEDLCVRQNRLAQERHTPDLKKINTV